MKISFGVIILLHFMWGVYSQGPCKRPCNSNTEPMTCIYHLVADYYYANQSDCLGCSRGVESDCQRQYCIPGDGTFRMVKAFNYTIPGPTIEVCEFDTLIVYVKNQLQTETTSVHWHGIHQIGTQDMDGVPMVTQRPILPNELYAYKFKAHPAGTHFYHSHSGSQRADGLFGKLIVRHYHNISHIVTYDQDIHSMALLEWFPIISEDVTMRYQRDARFYDVEPPKTLLVDRQAHTTPTRVPPTKYVVRQNLRYRFRVIHAGNIVCPMELSIDNHTLLVFNSDGHYFQPVEVDSIVLTNGERYDFVLHANQAISQYTIRIKTFSICNTRGYAILQYEGALNRAIDYDFVPALNTRLNCVFERTPGCIYYPQLQHIPRGFDDRDLTTMPYEVSLYFDQYNVAHDRFKGTIVEPELFTPFINKIGYIPPPRTLLCNGPQRTCNRGTVTRDFVQCTHLIEIPADGVIEMVLVDEGQLLDLSHPFHLHGYSFMVMSQGILGQNTTLAQVLTLYRSGALFRNSNPILKDTVAVPDGGYVVIRFLADNYGYWLMHCHVDFHTEEGMQLVIKTSIVPPIPRSCTCFV